MTLTPTWEAFWTLPTIDSSIAIAFRTLLQHDVVGVHSYGFERDSVFVAIVLHPLHVIEVPRAVGRLLADLCGEVFTP